MRSIYIASNTSGDENSPQYVGVEMNVSVAKSLLKYKSLAQQANQFDSNFYCIEFFNYLAIYGTTDLDVGDKWVQVTRNSITQSVIKLSCQVMKITDTGIVWAAFLVSSSNNAQFESEELSWLDIKEVAKGRNPFTHV